MQNKQLVAKDKVILQIDYETHIKDVYIQQDKNTHLNNLQTHFLQYLHIFKKMIQTTCKLTNIIGLLVLYDLYATS